MELVRGPSPVGSAIEVGRARRAFLAARTARAPVGEFWDFGVEGNLMVFIESGRIWGLELDSMKATFLKNETEATEAAFDKVGVQFQTATGRFFHRFMTAEKVDIKAAIEAAKFDINPTFTGVGRYETDLAGRNETALYIGNMGLFSFRMLSHKVEPLLLEPLRLEPLGGQLRVEYRNPVVLDDGSVFVQALESTSGSIGADGPVYRVHVSW